MTRIGSLRTVTTCLRFGPESSSDPVVLLHGFSGGPQDWEAVSSDLGSCEAHALPGHHPALPAPPDFDAAVNSLLSRLPKRPVVLMGYSLGGRLALGLVSAAPHRFRGLALVAAHTGLQDPVARTERRRRDTDLASLLRSRSDDFFRRWDAQEMFRNPPSPELEAWKARRAALDPTPLAQTLVALSPGHTPPFASLLADLRMPLCLAVGARDTRYRDHYAALSGLRPDLPVHVIPDAAHRVLIDAPRPLGSVLGAFVAGIRGAAS